MGKPFVKGDPRAGRKPGSKTRLTAQIVQDMFTSWNEAAFEGAAKTKGQAALEILYNEKPLEYAKLYAQTFVPKDMDIDVKLRAASEMADDEIDIGIARLREQLAEELAKAEPPLLIEAKANNDREPAKRN
jgi:hypothetical protein